MKLDVAFLDELDDARYCRGVDLDAGQQILVRPVVGLHGHAAFLDIHT